MWKWTWNLLEHVYNYHTQAFSSVMAYWWHVTWRFMATSWTSFKKHNIFRATLFFLHSHDIDTKHRGRRFNSQVLSTYAFRCKVECKQEKKNCNNNYINATLRRFWAFFDSWILMAFQNQRPVLLNLFRFLSTSLKSNTHYSSNFTITGINRLSRKLLRRLFKIHRHASLTAAITFLLLLLLLPLYNYVFSLNIPISF